jgi:predicted transcriptional regulator
MSMTLTLTLDDDCGAYLEGIASDQGRAVAEIATWILTEDLRREQAIDEDIVARLNQSRTSAKGIENWPMVGVGIQEPTRNLPALNGRTQALSGMQPTL